MSTVVPPDPRFGSAGRGRPLVAYDAGLRPPPLPADAPGGAVQHLDVADTITAVIDHLTRPLNLGGEERGRVRRRSERLLHWLTGFDGNTWEQRWLASGADAAPRGWQQAAFPHHNQRWQRYAVTGGLYHLIQARVLRPSYARLLLCRAGTALTRFLEVNAADQLPGLRAVPAYQQALIRQRCDAEHCISRVMIRTGKPLDALTGEELLHYADIVRTSGRHRREHLAWELLVALGLFGCSTLNWIWIWPTFRDRLDPCPRLVGQLARRTRLRSSSNPARPYICRLIILMRFTDPSTAPELCSRVRPLSTAS